MISALGDYDLGATCECSSSTILSRSPMAFVAAVANSAMLGNTSSP